MNEFLFSKQFIKKYILNFKELTIFNYKNAIMILIWLKNEHVSVDPKNL